MNLYAVLDLDSDATPEAIKGRYRLLAQRLHPDKPGGDKEGFQALQKAYEVLSDPERRKAYDETGETAVPNTLQERAIKALPEVLAECIDSADGKTTNMVGFMRENLARKRRDILQTIKQCEAKLARREAMLTRLVRKGSDEDYLKAALLMMIDAEKSALVKMQDIQALISAIEDLLNDYSYGMPEPDIQLGRGAIYSSGTTVRW
jgi:curved DNA-binding protein CbpA